MSASTDTMYNSNSRYLHEMYRIYFSSTPLEVIKSNYLISATLIEEAYKVSNSPFGDVNSNELELTLLNDNGIFNPKNVDSPYYGKIRRGIKIEKFIRPDEVDEWDPLGVFYVTDWDTSSSGMTAEVVAHDRLYNILNSPVPSLKITRDVHFATFIKDYFKLFGADVSVDSSIDLVLPYGFTYGYTSNKKLLADLMLAALADCFCDHTGQIVIKSKITTRNIRAKLTDDDQIISIAIKQSLATDYDSVSVICNTMQESAEQSILLIEDINTPPGTTSTGFTKFETPGVLSVKSLCVESDNPVKVTDFIATADGINCFLQSNADTTARLDITGIILKNVSSIVATEGQSSLSLDSKFVQTPTNANMICQFADRYVNESLPTLDLVIRGNPKLQIGDKLQVQSTRYKTEYVGILTKAKYEYSGGLRCEISLTADMTKEA